ncbi:MAG TPA: urate hydroxylase PuuD [Stellaceae bacterium]|nr:urate hydroxylase PuuD [Stellaceae bacterium]
MSGIITEWLNLLLRWLHIVVGIGWIGTSFFFIWLDAHLSPKPGAARGSVGEIWLFHSGGFYEVEKKLVVPTEVLPSLHWFKWEAYLTWISGVLLLIVVYYLGGGVFLIDPEQSSIGLPAAVLIGLGTLALGWLIYDFLWRSPLAQKPALAAAISFLLLAGLAFALTRVFSGRAAYMHVGALLGTIMAANVWRVIQPSQREMYRVNLTGGEPDAALSKAAKLRSTHNNYMTLPVIFVMVSNHFPSTYGNVYNWLVLLVLFLAGAGVRHYLNIHDRDPRAGGVVLALSAAAFIGLIAFTALPSYERATAAAGAGRVAFAEVRPIIVERCVSCHSAKPSDDVVTQAPNGVTFDTPAQIKGFADKIEARAVATDTMPLGNKTGMTETERVVIGRWIAEGAPLD